MQRIGIVGVVVLAGCVVTSHAQVSVQPLNAAPYPLEPRAPETVEMFTTSELPHAYVEVAALAASGGDGGEQYATMRREAGKLGCDGLIITAPPHALDEHTSGSSATCIAWHPNQQ